MEAGKELNALIEYEVFRKPEGWVKDWADHLSPLMQNLMIPDYSTDIAAAWLVADKLGLSVLKVTEGWQARKFVSMRDESASNAKTAPLAICLAALKAVGVAVS